MHALISKLPLHPSTSPSQRCEGTWGKGYRRDLPQKASKRNRTGPTATVVPFRNFCFGFGSTDFGFFFFDFIYFPHFSLVFFFFFQKTIKSLIFNESDSKRLVYTRLHFFQGPSRVGISAVLLPHFLIAVGRLNENEKKKKSSVRFSMWGKEWELCSAFRVVCASDVDLQSLGAGSGPSACGPLFRIFFCVLARDILASCASCCRQCQHCCFVLTLQGRCGSAVSLLFLVSLCLVDVNDGQRVWQRFFFSFVRSHRAPHLLTLTF